MYTNFSDQLPACLLAIQISQQRGGPMQPMARAALETGKGLCGDRFFASRRPVTLLGEYDLQQLAFQSGLALQFQDVRRNLLVRGLDPQTLLGKTFYIGSLPFEAIAPCPPCAHLRTLLQATYGRAPDLRNWAGGIVIRPLARGLIQAGDNLCL